MNKIEAIRSAALGQTPADLVFKNVNLINVFTNEIDTTDVAVTEGTIAGAGIYTGIREIDCTGKYMCPGFIDGHMHLESSMVTPKELSGILLKNGTTAVIADPHEMVNVSGSKALDYLLEASEHLPLDIFIMLPSSVPSTPFETNGADFTAADIQRYLNHPKVLGLGEVMCFPEVVKGEVEIYEKMRMAEGRIIDGHAPSLWGRFLQAYAAAGISTEHECTTFKEAKEKARAGIKILVREGSAAKNMDLILPPLLQSGIPYGNFLFCTDDKQLEEIQREGHINFMVRKAISMGFGPGEAIAMATIHTAAAYGLKKRGAIAPGYIADLLLLDDLNTVHIDQVYKQGQLVTDHWLAQIKERKIPKELLQTVSFEDINPKQLTVYARENKSSVIELIPRQIVTKHCIESIPERGGVFVPNNIYSKLCVIERHRGTGNVTAAPLKGYGIRQGAIAVSVAHDSHNIIAAGDNDEDICLAVNHLKQLQGGYAISSEGEILGSLALPLFGLMSIDTGKNTCQAVSNLIEIARKMGVPEAIEPFSTLSFLALPVIPEIRLTDKGLFLVEQRRFVTY